MDENHRESALANTNIGSGFWCHGSCNCCTVAVAVAVFGGLAPSPGLLSSFGCHISRLLPSNPWSRIAFWSWLIQWLQAAWQDWKSSTHWNSSDSSASVGTFRAVPGVWWPRWSGGWLQMSQRPSSPAIAAARGSAVCSCCRGSWPCSTGALWWWSTAASMHVPGYWRVTWGLWCGDCSGSTLVVPFRKGSKVRKGWTRRKHRAGTNSWSNRCLSYGATET